MKLNIFNKLLVTSALLFVANACEVTDVDPANRIPEDQAFANAARVQSTVIGVYESAQRGWYGGTVDRGYPFGAASTAQGDMRGEDMYNDQLFYETTYVGSWTTSTANNNGMWISLFRVINRCNAVLEGITKAETAGVLTAAQAGGYRGEMYFLRALCYHELALDFCRPYSDDPSKMGVPFRDFAVDLPSKVEEALKVPRGTVAEIYAHILSDLDNAENLLAKTGGPFRATKGAAIALKTRVKLHMEDWPGVIAEYTKLTTGYTYALTNLPSGPFTTGTSVESVFSFQNSNVSNPGTNAALVNMYGSPGRNGRGLVKISPVIWKAPFWHADDLRRGSDMVDQHSTGIYTFKYKGFGTNDDPTPIIRHAEVLLNAAEAYARQDQFTDAITLLNSVRDRAVPDAVPSYDLAALGGNRDGVIQGVLNERRIELLAEGKRWGDIHRLSGEGRMTGIPAKAATRSVSTLAQYSTGTVTLDHAMTYANDLFIWPIPLTETLNNPTLAAQQNPGYN